MKLKYLVVSIFVIATTSAFAQTFSNSLIVGKIDSIQSQALNETRKIWIHLPENYIDDRRKRYPIALILDAEEHFYPAMGVIHHLSRNSISPEMILVGVTNTDRVRDFTPSNYYFKQSGGAEKFTMFLENELFPYLNKHYPVSQERLIIGHSLGGLFVVNTLLRHTELFKYYISIDPSLSWDNQKLLKENQIVLKSRELKARSFFLALASTNGIDTTDIQKNKEDITLHMRSILFFKKLLQNRSDRTFEWKFRYYEDESHGSVPLISMYEGLQFLYRTKYIELNADKLKDFEGKYHFYDARQGRDEYLRIIAKSDHLIFKPEHLWDGMEMRFAPVSDLGFYCKEMRIPLQFTKNKKGNVTELTVFRTNIWRKIND
jgi:predicted alpha/beta superfamily hydrolase